MTLLLVLVAMGILLGAVSYTPFPVFLVAAAVVGAWLLAFCLRERLGHHRNR
ncbi:hypothetical protein [Streptomyces sp. NPDC026673]|uniref:hypothetical protein n=1 Tax=Streptomyces sp. NPDC026673 TaxID=3155724 RepID=UPI00340E6840